MPQNIGSLAPADFPQEATILGAIRKVRHELAAIRPDDMDAAIQLIAERAQSLNGATGAAIALKQEDVLVCVATSGVHAPGLRARLQIGSGFSGQCERSGNRCVVTMR